MKMTRNLLLAAAAMLAATSLLAADAPLFKDEVIAKGKGVEVKRSQLDEALEQFKASLASQNRQFPEEQRANIEQSLVDRLIITRIMLNLATPEDRTKGKESAEKFIAEARKSAPSEESFKRQLMASGMAYEQWTNQIAERAVCEELLNREILNKIKIPDAEVKKFFDENTAKFDKPEMVRAAHILIGTRNPVTGEELNAAGKKEKKDLIEKLLARAKKGEDFAKLASEHSEDPGSKEKGGEYTFPRGQMVPEFEAAAFAQKTNEISAVITTQYGFHIIKTLEKLPAEKGQYAKLEKEIREYLSRQEAQKQMPPFFEKLKADAGVTSTLPAAKPAAPATPAAPPAPKK